MERMPTRLSPAAHAAQPWRIHELARDFEVLDVWALSTPGGPDDFAQLLRLFGSFDPQRLSPVVQALFAARWALGRAFGLDGSSQGIEARVPSLRERLAEDLANSFPEDVSTGLFSPLYATRDEAAMEMANRTVHGVMHLGWVPDGNGGYRGQMTVLVKPNGVLGSAYMAVIAPFRHFIVYPAMLGTIGQAWRAQSRGRVTVRQIDPPQEALDHSTLPRIDYADAFLVGTEAHPEWTAERWAVALLEEAPAATRAQLLAGWSALGLKPATSDRSVLGWNVRRSSADRVLLGRDSRIGMPGELLFALHQEGLLFATFVQHRTAATRVVWAAVVRTHVRTVLELLGRAGRVATPGEVTGSAGAG
jgi:hypothetical protein